MKRLSCLAFLAFATSHAYAGIAFTNFNAADEFDTGVGQSILGPTNSHGFSRWGNSFESLASGPVSQIRVAMGLVEGTNFFRAQMFEDDAGKMGSMIGSWDVRDKMTDVLSPSIVAIDTGSTGNLGTGKRYWVMLEADDDTWAAWFYNIDHLIDKSARDGGSGFEYVDAIQGAYEVSVVPEPCSLLACGVGAVALAARRRRQNVPVGR